MKMPFDAKSAPPLVLIPSAVRYGNDRFVRAATIQ